MVDDPIILAEPGTTQTCLHGRIAPSGRPGSTVLSGNRGRHAGSGDSVTGPRGRRPRIVRDAPRAGASCTSRRLLLDAAQTA